MWGSVVPEKFQPVFLAELLYRVLQSFEIDQYRASYTSKCEPLPHVFLHTSSIVHRLPVLILVGVQLPFSQLSFLVLPSMFQSHRRRILG